MEIVATSKPDFFRWQGFGYPYDRIISLQCEGREVGVNYSEQENSNFRRRRFELSHQAGQRLVEAWEQRPGELPLSCYLFAYLMSGVAFTTDEILINYDEYPRVDTLSEGSVGLVSIKGIGVVHLVGYGMGNEGLQVLSGAGGELGIASNDSVRSFYAQYYGIGEAELYEVPSKLTG